MLDVVDVRKRFESKVAVDAVSLSVAPGEIMAVLGPSGCGKSTLLSLIAGLEKPDAGDVRWAGESLLATPTHQRGFGLMFQDYALFPHRDVFANVAFGLRMQGLATESIRERVGAALEMVGLSGYGRRSVTTLSGGEQQRVALARALAPRPRVLMLDEPLGALDRALREQLVEELGRILHSWEGRPAVLYVTHDQVEAFALADRVAVMRAGLLEQIGTPDVLVQGPVNAFVADFLGLGALVPARRLSGNTAETPWGPWPLTSPANAQGTLGHILIRLDAAAGSAPVEGPRLTGKVVGRLPQSLGVRVLLDLGTQGESITVPLILRSEHAPAVGQSLTVALNPERLTFIAATS